MEVTPSTVKMWWIVRFYRRPVVHVSCRNDALYWLLLYFIACCFAAGFRPTNLPDKHACWTRIDRRYPAQRSTLPRRLPVIFGSVGEIDISYMPAPTNLRRQHRDGS